MRTVFGVVSVIIAVDTFGMLLAEVLPLIHSHAPVSWETIWGLAGHGLITALFMFVSCWAFLSGRTRQEADQEVGDSAAATGRPQGSAARNQPPADD
jgi:hypothetical protein